VSEVIAPIAPENDPIAQAVHDDDPVTLAYVPVEQLEQTLAARAEYVPCPQATHDDDTVAPVPLEALPATQFTHVEAPVLHEQKRRDKT
jgi:hypothetical protein